MKKKFVSILIMMLLIATSSITLADWDPEDGHKMHYPQLPDPNGWDVNAQNELADDWQCSETGYVKDIHFWGSWENDIKGTINSFNLAIYSNNPGPPSKPDELMWEREIFIGDWVERGPFFGDQGFYWPEDDNYDWNNHDEYYQYNIFLDEPWFLQEEDNIYWLSILADVETGTGTWGWKSSKNHWNDDAVWRAPTGQWIELYEPEAPITNQFWLTMSNGEPIEGGGTDYFEDGTSLNGWYYYNYLWPDWWWWNIWFYDHPFDPAKYKDIYVSFICEAMGPVWFVVNWATDIWYYEGVPGRPPLPQDVVGNPQWEDMVIGRWPSPVQPILIEPGFNEFEITIPEYNPEWVSIDFMGMDFAIYEGIIIHQCLPPENAESLDLAFVINGEDIVVNNPPNTPSKPAGPTSVNEGIQYTYTTSTTDPDNDNIKYGFDFDNDGVIEPGHWTSFYPSSSTCTVKITFTGAGTRYLRVKSEDVHGAQSGFSSSLTVVVSGANNAPNTPNTPSGPSTGNPGVSYTYSTSTTDPDGDNVKYGWDWNGDGIVNEWTSHQSSGTSVSTSHSWVSTGIYQVKVKAEDINGAQSAFSSVKTVNITSNNPPNTPSCSYDNIGDKLSITATDPDGDQVRYGVDWDADGIIDQWTILVASGTQQNIDCGGRKGTVEVIAEDEHGAQSLPISITSKNNEINRYNSIWFVRGLFRFLDEDEDYIYLKAISAKFRGFGNGIAVYHLLFCPIKISKPFYGMLPEKSIPFLGIGICKEWDYT